MMSRALANPPTIDGELIALWSAVLTAARLTPEEVKRAALDVIATREFFPQPKHFIEAIRPPMNFDVAVEGAWQRALDCVRRYGGNASLRSADVDGDGKVLWALDRMGWVRTCREMGEDNRAIFRAEFVRLYRLAQQEGSALDHVAGGMEIENAARRGEGLNAVLCGRPDWDGPAIPPKDAHLMRERPALPPAQFGSVEGFTSLGDAIGEDIEREDEEE